MAGSKPQKRITFGEKMKDKDDRDVDFFGLIRQKISTPNFNNVPLGGESAPAPSAGTGFLRTIGDTMGGPIAYLPGAVTIATGVIDVSQAFATGYHSLVIVNGQGAVNDDLDTIGGAAFAGQILIIQTVIGQTITLKHLTGNIRCSTGADIPLIPQTGIQLYFDSVTLEWTDVVGFGGATGGVFANQMLSNLVATLINVSLLPNADATLDLGSSLKSWDSLFIGKVRFDDNQSAPTGTSANLIQGQASGIALNVNIITDTFRWYFDGNLEWEMDQDTLTGDNLILGNTLTINNSGADPLSDGDFTRNLTDVKVYSGGAVRNLSSIGVAGGANTFLSNLAGVTSINSDLLPQANLSVGNATFIWEGVYTEKIDLNESFSIVTTRWEIYRDANNTIFNVPLTKKFKWQFGGVDKAELTDQFFTAKNIIVGISGTGGVVSLSDIVSHPGVNGDLYREGIDVKVFSGGFERSLSGIPVTGGADIALSNLAGTTTINSDLLPQANLSVGNSTFIWEGVFTEKVDLNQSFSIVTTRWEIYRDANNTIINVPSGKLVQFQRNGVAGVEIAGATVSADAMNTDVLQLGVSFVPSFTGELRSDGTDVYIFSGGLARNVSTFGTGSQTPWLSNINANQLDLLNIRTLFGRDTGGIGSFKIVFDANEDGDTWIGDDSAVDTIRFVANAVVQARVSSAGWVFDNKTLMNSVYSEWISQSSGSVPTPAIGERNVFVNSATGKFSVKTDTGAVISLEEGGGSGILWSTPVNANIIPDLDNTRDLGSAVNEFRDMWIDGIATIDFLQVDVGANFFGNVTMNSNLTVNGNFLTIGTTTTFGNSASDDIIFVGGVASNILPDSPVIRDLGTFTNKFGNMYMRGIGHGEPTNQGGLGFFGKALITRRTVNQASGGDSLLALIGKFNTLLAALGPTSGYNLVNVV